MTHRTRSDKIENIFMALSMLEKPDATPKRFNLDVTHTSLIGPYLAVSTSDYEMLITVPKEGPVVICEIRGIKQRFAESGAFLDFFRRSLEPARPATNTLAALIPDSTRVGNSVVFERRGTIYMCVEEGGSFDVRYNNQKMTMTHDDIATILL